VIRLSRSLIVDASVALKWVVTEPGSEEAASLLDELTTGTLALLAPEHLVARNFDAVLVTADERLHTAARGMPIRLHGH
jgi:predicted nucleic acid-binding protein